MAAPIEFNIRITGGAATELKKTGEGFDKADKGARKSAEGVKIFEGEVGKLAGELGGLNINLSALSEGRGSIFTFDLAQGARAAYEAVSRVVEKIVDLGKETVLAVAGAEDLNFAITRNMGDEGAQQIDELADAYERLTRIDGDDVKKALLPLMEQGITNVQLLDDITAAAGDVAARRNTGVDGFRAYVGALSDIAIVGGTKIKGQLKELGIRPAEYYKALGGLLGKSAKEAEELAKAGKVANETLLSTAIHVIDLREGGKGVGAALLESSQNLGGVIDKLRNAPENLMKRLLGSEAMDEVKVKLEGILGVLNGPEGLKLIEEFGVQIRDTFRSVTQEDVVGALRLMGDVVGGIVKGLGLAVQLAADIERLGRNKDVKVTSIDGQTRAIGGDERNAVLDRAGVGFSGRLLDRVGIGRGANDRVVESQVALEELKAFNDAHEAGEVIGESFADGVRNGIVNGAPKTAEAAVVLAKNTHAAASGPEGLDAHSPSRKGIALGKFYAQGLAEGMRDEEQRLALTATRTVSQGVAAASSAAPAAGGASATTNQYFIQLPGGAMQAAEASGEAWVAQMQAWLTRLGYAVGATAPSAA